MSNPKCARCTKTVYPTEKVDAGGSIWHKLCFKCNQEGCNIALSLSTFMAHEGQVYCKKHVPKPGHTQVADSVQTKAVLSTPKKPVENLGHVQKGTGETPRVDGGSMAIQGALNAPHAKAENLGHVSRV